MKGCHLEKWLIPGSVLIALFSSNLTAAQVVGDTTLPVGERSQVTGNPNFQIDGGARRGGNLFHSFSEFSIPTGGSAFFNNAADIQNILTRVTGGSISNIDGLIQANGTANLFLLNPNGIIFGANASLNVGGSFIATTADAIGLANGDIFSANPGQPLPSQLLNVNPNALFFNQMAAQAIVNRSTANNTGLQVPPRQNLLLVGGAVQLDGAQLISPGSYVELAGIGGGGTVGLATTDEDWQLSVPFGVTRANVSLSNGGDINVKGDGGSIRILGQNIDISGSSLRVEIPSDSRLPDTQTGDIDLNATGSIAISNSILANSLFGQGTMGGINLTAGERISFARSYVYNTLERTGVGKVGDINISTGSVSLTGGASLVSYTSGRGNAGSVNIHTSDTVSLDGAYVSNTVQATGVGNGGGININTGSLFLTGGASLFSYTSGQGNAGSVKITARGDVDIANDYTGASLLVESQGNIRFGGNITTDGIVNLISGAGNVSTRAISTNGGAIHITSAGSVTSNQQPLDTSNGANDGGSITVSANGDISTGTITTLSSSSSSGQDNSGNGGDVTLNTTNGNISIGFTRTGSFSSLSTGRGGDVTVSTANGSIIGDDIYALNSSGSGSAGRGGNITLTAANGSIIPGRLYSNSGSISGIAGNGGRIAANATNGDIKVSRIISNSGAGLGGTASNGGEVALSVTNGNIITSSIDSNARTSTPSTGARTSTPSTGSGTTGNGGAITLTAINGNISTGGRLESNVIAESDAGNGGAITLFAPDGSITTKEWLYSGSFSATGRGGRGGDITLIAGGTIQTYDPFSASFVLLSTINSTGTLGSGNITIDTQSPFALPRNFLISSDTFGSGRGGDIQITAPSISFTDGSQISASTHSSGQGGNITLRASDYIQMSGATDKNIYPIGVRLQSGFAGLPAGTYVGGYIPTGANPSAVATFQPPADTVYPSGAFTQTTVGATGSAGNLSIETGRLVIEDGAALATTTFGQNSNAGSISIRARDSVTLANGRILSGVAGGAIGDSGGITIDTPSLMITGGSIQTQTLGQGRAGDIQITAPNAANLSGIDSGIRSGSGGSNTLLGTTGNNIGQGGNISVTTGTLNVTDGAALNAQTQTNSRGGDITVNARSLFLTNGGQLTANTNFGGNAGNISIDADTIGLAGVGTSGASSGIFTATTQTATGQGGELRVNANTLGVSDGAVLSARTGGSGRGGDIFVNANTINLTSGGELVTTTSGSGRAGDIEVTVGDRLLISGSDPTFTTRQSQFGNISVDPVSAASGLFTNTEASSSGAGGDIKVTTDSLSIVNGGQLVATTTGRGDAGKITVNATGAIDVAGVSSTGNPSGLFTATEQTATGRGGEIQVNSDRLGISDGAVLSARSSSSGRGGDITVSADTVDLSSGGQLLTTASSSGRAGDITVKTPDLQLSGTTSGLFAGTTSSADAGNLTIQPQGNGQSVRVNLQEGAKITASTGGSGRGGQLTIAAPESITLTGDGSIIAAETGGSGTGGNLNLQTGTLNIQNGAQVTVSSEGTGSAGSLFVDATNRIFLDNGGRIRADTSGGGGDINLRSPLILLRNGSRISTNARGINIPGGNIDIYTDNLVAVPKENSDITANSEDFRGGNVTIRTNGIFGIEFREQLTPLSEITATGVNSEFPGTVNIITAGIDPSRGLAQLPTDVGDASDAIATACRDVRDSSFVVTGRGGLPPTPQQALGDDPRWRDWRTPAVVSRQPNAPTNGSLPPSANLRSSKSALVEATGWVIEPDGKVILTASVPHVTSPNRWGQPVNCDRS